jgi:hypothetical protein
MNQTISFKCVDCILNLFYGYYPYGANYFTLTYRLNFEATAWETMFDFIMDENLIETWGDDDKQVITEKGILLIKEHCGIQKYIERYEKKKKSKTSQSSKNLQNQKKQIKVLSSKIIKPQSNPSDNDPMLSRPPYKIERFLDIE